MRALIGIAGVTLLLAACGQASDTNNVAVAEPESNLSTSAAVPGEDLAALLGSEPRLRSLIEAAGMRPVLSGKEPYTILAPSAAALDALPAGTLERLATPEQKAELTALLRAHILPGTILSADLARAVESGGGKATVATMAGEPLTVTRDGDAFRIARQGGSGARISGTEQPARNGVVHQIDAVLGSST
ncbi:fasciclin domain-containing protein [Sphingomonas sp. LHG3406-1]|uniref:fasciclin domain-containing protein n=1 Tax=Sphingomonas sp. LHG3406-1 TaxID=2804617 RepID=UPI00261069C1|nr:fasciclin domain-containing protein [Sphingomonas sp. LHG3406-1]